MYIITIDNHWRATTHNYNVLTSLILIHRYVTRYENKLLVESYYWLTKTIFWTLNTDKKN